MGASQSSNVANVTLEAVTDVSTKIIANSNTSTNQTQGIVITGGKGGVKVGNITQKTTATVNTKNLMKAMSSTTAQQDLTAKLSQAATSITSGINFAQYSDANNEIDNTLKQTIDITSDIENSCVGQVNSQQTIVIDGGEGGVVGGNINQESVANIFQECITNAVTSNSSAQKLQYTLDQSATAKSEGLTAWGIALIIGMVILAIAVPVIVEGNVVINGIMKLFFPLMIVAGLVMIFLYFTWKAPTSSVTKFSQGLSTSTDCNPSGATTSTKYPTFEAAHDAFMANNSYVAMDWVGFGATKGGRLGPKLAQAKTTFYTSMANPECKVPVDQNVQLFARPTFRSGKGVPSDAIGNAGDYYLNISTGQTYFKVKQQWVLQPGTVSTDNQTVTFGNSLPTSSLKPGAYYMDTSNPKSLTLYKGGQSSPVKTGIPGPGYVVSNPKEANMSAVKVKGDKPYLLWLGGTTVAMGFVGFVLTTVFGGNKKGAVSKGPAKPSKN